MADDRRYGVNDWIAAYDAEVPSSFVLRRRIARKLSELGETLVRADVDDTVLTAWLMALESLPVPGNGSPAMSQAELSRRLVAGEATGTEVLMNFDYDAASGLSNPAAPDLLFVEHAGLAPDGSRTLVEARTTLGALHGGGPGNAHGGILAAMLDVVLARVQYRAGYMGVTGYLNVRYLQPTPLHTPLSLRAWPLSVIGRKARVRGGIWIGEEQTVEAEALFVARPSPR